MWAILKNLTEIRNGIYSVCKNCNYQSNDDRIGAMNLWRKGVEYVEAQLQRDSRVNSTIWATVNLPIVT